MRFFIFQFLIFSIGISARAAELRLSLDECIKMGLERNTKIKIDKLDLELSQIQFDHSFHDNFLPSIGLELNSSRSKTTYLVAGSEASFNRQSATNFPEETGLSLTLSSYNLFSAWQNASQYRIDKLEFEKSKLEYLDSIRAAKLQIADAYFDLATKQMLMAIAKRMIKESRAVVELYDTKVKLGKASEDDLRLANLDLENSERKIEDYENDRKDAIAVLVRLISEKEDTEVIATSPLDYNPLNLNFSAIRNFLDQSPDLRRPNYDSQKSEFEIEKAHRQRLPMPTLEMSKVVWTTNQSYQSQTSTIETNSSSRSGAVDLSFSVKWNIPIWGPGGLFGSREVQSARIEYRKALYERQSSFEELQKNVMTIINELRQTEANIKSLEKSRLKSEELAYSRISQIGKGKANFIEIRTAINSWTEIETDLQNKYKSHFSRKLDLMRALGLSNLPGDKQCQYAYCIDSFQ